MMQFNYSDYLLIIINFGDPLYIIINIVWADISDLYIYIYILSSCFSARTIININYVGRYVLYIFLKKRIKKRVP